jgi:hypothetical protein
MKIQQVIFYILKWIALVILTILSTTEVQSGNSKIIMYVLILFIAVTLVIEGRKEFKPNN